MNEIKINTPGIKAQIYPWEASPEKKVLYDKIATQTYSLLVAISKELNLDTSNFRASFDGLYKGFEYENRTSLTIQIKDPSDTWKEPWTGNALIPQTVSGEGLALWTYSVDLYNKSTSQILSQLIPVIREKDIIRLMFRFALQVRKNLTPEEIALIAPNTPIIVTGGNLTEIKVNSPIPFKFEIEQKAGFWNDTHPVAQVYFGKFYLYNNLIDDEAVYSSHASRNYIQFQLTVDNGNPEFEKLKELLKINNVEIEAPFSTEGEISYIIDADRVNIVNNLKEIKVENPNSRERQIYFRILPMYPEARIDNNWREGHIIFLFPNSKVINRNSIIIEPSGKIDVYLGNDINGRRFKHIDNALKYIEANPVEKPLDEIKVNIPNPELEFPLMINNQEDYNYYAERLLQSGKRWFRNGDGSLDDISSIKWPDTGPDNNPFPFCIKLNYHTPEVIHAVYGPSCMVNEIKVNAPQPFMFEIVEDRYDDFKFGKIYFNGKLLDDKAIYSISPLGGDSTKPHIVFELDSVKYKNLKNILKSNNARALNQNGIKRNYNMVIDNVDNVKIVNTSKPMNEIRINKPGKPFKFVETRKDWGSLFYDGRLIDDNTFIVLSFEDNSQDFTPIGVSVYKTDVIQYDLHPYVVDHPLGDELFGDDSKITAIDAKFVDINSEIEEIKVLTPMDSRRPYINNKYVDLRSIELEDVFQYDYPDFVDAYISYAEFEDGTELTQDQIELVQIEWPDLVNEIATGVYLSYGNIREVNEVAMSDLGKIEKAGGKMVDSVKIGIYELALFKFDWGLTISLTSNDKEYLVPQGMDKIATSSSIRDIIPIMRQFVEKIKEWIDKYGEINIGSANEKKAQFYFKLFEKEFEQDTNYRIITKLKNDGFEPDTQTDSWSFYVGKGYGDKTLDEIKVNNPMFKYKTGDRLRIKDGYKKGKLIYIMGEPRIYDKIVPGKGKVEAYAYPISFTPDGIKKEWVSEIDLDRETEIAVNEIKINNPTFKYKVGQKLVSKNNPDKGGIYIVGEPIEDTYQTSEYTYFYPFSYTPNGKSSGKMSEPYLDSHYVIPTNEIKVESPITKIPIKFNRYLTAFTDTVPGGKLYDVIHSGFPESNIRIYKNEPDIAYLSHGNIFDVGSLKTTLDRLDIPYEQMISSFIIPIKYVYETD